MSKINLADYTDEEIYNDLIDVDNIKYCGACADIQMTFKTMKYCDERLCFDNCRLKRKNLSAIIKKHKEMNTIRRIGCIRI